MTSRQLMLFAALWLLLLAAAFSLDTPVARAVEGSELQHATKHAPAKYFFRTIKFPGDFRMWLIVAAILFVIHPLRWQAAGFLLLSGIPAMCNWFIKWGFGRARPFRFPPDDTLEPFSFRPFFNGFSGLIHQTNLSFASGHCAVAFGAAAAMALLLPRGRWLFYAVAALVAFERVAENAHYLSDTVAAAGFSILLVHILWRLCKVIFAPKSPFPGAARDG